MSSTSTDRFENSSYSRSRLADVLLVCGLISPLLYVGTDLALAVVWKSYSYVNQTVSELSAVGAPTRSAWIIMSFIFNPFVIAFGIGVSVTADGKRAIRTSGVLISIWGLLGFVWLLFPMHLRGAIGSTTDTMHLVLAGATVPLMMVFIGFGSGARGAGFRLYSIATIVAMLVFGTLVSTQAPKVAAQLPTPGLGVMERVAVYCPMVWTFTLAVGLFRRTEKGGIRV